LSWPRGAQITILRRCRSTLRKPTCIILQGTTGSLYKIPITNCVPATGVPGHSLSNVVGNLGALSYYWNGSAVATGFSGRCVHWNQRLPCCAPVDELVEEYGSNRLHDWPPTLLGGVHFAGQPHHSIAKSTPATIFTTFSGVALYEVCPSPLRPRIDPGRYMAATPIAYGSGYTTVVGVSLDSCKAICSSLTAAVPPSSRFRLRPSGSTSALNPNDQYIVATGSALTLANAVAPDPFGKSLLRKQHLFVF